MTLLRCVFIVIVILGLGGTFSVQAKDFISNDTSVRIQQIPLEDRYVLEAFFRELLFQEDGAFVLFGTKPIAFSSHYILERCYLGYRYTFRHFMQNGRLKEGWEIWQKYMHMFPMKNFMIKSFYSPYDDGVSLYFINRALCREMIHKYMGDFKSVLGEHASYEHIMEWLNDPNRDLMKVLGDHEALLGTLLGYGRDNAWFFHRRKVFVKDLFEFSLTPKRAAAIAAEQAPCSGPYWEEERYQNFKYITLPSFVASIHSQETKELEKAYLEERREICKRYANGRFLEITLEALTK